MTEGNIPVTDRKKQLLLYLLPGYSKNLLKEKLNCLNSYELRIGKSWKLNEVILEWLHFAMASLSNGTTLLDNGFWNSFEIAFLWIFHKSRSILFLPFSYLSMFTYKSYYLSWRRVIANEKATLAVQFFHNVNG